MLTVRQQVEGYARIVGLTVKASRKPSCVSISRNIHWDGETWRGYTQVFDNWSECYDYLKRARDAHQFEDKPYPWEAA